MRTTTEIAALELQARQLPSVSAVSCSEHEGAVTVQVLVTDPATIPAVRRELEALRGRLPSTGPVVLEIEAVGVPRRSLAVERELSAVPGVRSCHVLRGARGEVRHVTVVITPGSDVETVRERLTAGLGPDFPPQRVQIEVGSG